VKETEVENMETSSFSLENCNFFAQGAPLWKNNTNNIKQLISLKRDYANYY